MQIILKCRDSYGSASFSAEEIEGRPAPERRYQIENHTILLAGQPDFILHHDAAVLLSMPDGLYRMPTPAEQDALVQTQQASGSVQESAPVAPEQKSGDDSQPPALLDKIKKVAGG